MQSNLVTYADLDWGDGNYRFRLGYTEMQELEAKCDCGPMVLLARLGSSEWRQADIAETIRLGLIGGGMKPVEAVRIIRTYVHDRPDWLHNAAIARAIVMAFIFGVDPTEIKEGQTDGEISEPGQASGEAGSDPAGDPVGDQAGASAGV